MRMTFWREVRCARATLLGAAVACGTESDAAELREPAVVRQAQATQSAAGTQGTLAPFVQHPENIQPGLSLTRPFTQLTNPFEGDRTKTREGEALFVSYNCMDCHGAGGSGAMGPSLADGRMHFGGTGGEGSQSTYEGRRKGMPAWGGRIPDNQP